MKIFATLILIPLIGLTGCATTSSKFDCPMKPGIRCESIDQINARVNRGEIGNGSMRRGGEDSQPIFIASQNQDSLRQNEMVMRLWVAPYVDQSDNYHLASNVYTVVRPSYWSGNPVKAVKEE